MIEIRKEKDGVLLSSCFDLERAKDPVRIMLWAKAEKETLIKHLEQGGAGVFIRLTRKELEKLYTELGHYLTFMKSKEY